MSKENAPEVHKYDIRTLCEVIAKYSGNSTEEIKGKLHHHYFKGYCDDIGVKTFIVEHDYIDQHYLEDYSAYYVRCFHPYKRFCTRLHFFKDEVKESDLIKHLEGQLNLCDNLQKSYLGFVIIKPLPQTVIGRTCLKTYPSEGRRHFPIIREYCVNLFGIPLKVDSLAFQEQDKVAAACATSALWSVFQGTGKYFQHKIPSPVQITQAATEKLPLETRVLPNNGLTPAMMAHAIRHVGLEPDLIKVSNEYVLKSSAYAYLKGRIPMILGIELVDASNIPNQSRGFHAVAVTGYSLGGAVRNIGDDDLLLTANRVDRIYVHDDQVGPFARMLFDDNKIKLAVDGKLIELFSISTSWIGDNKFIGSVRARPTILLIPIYHKIRIPFETVHDAILGFDQFIMAILEIDKDYANFNGRLEWDIYLTTNNDLKLDVRKRAVLKGGCLSDFLTQGMPKYVWRATALQGDKVFLDLIFDATDIERGELLFSVLEYDSALSMLIRLFSREKSVEKFYQGEPVQMILNWFKKQPIPDLDS
jgi:hypothetical protein